MTQDVTAEDLTVTEGLKDRLRACRSVTEVNETVKLIAGEVAAHADRDPVGVMQIRNLAAWRRDCMKGDLL